MLNVFNKIHIVLYYQIIYIVWFVTGGACSLTNSHELYANIPLLGKQRLWLIYVRKLMLKMHQRCL